MKIRFALFLFLLACFGFFVGGQSKPEAGQDWVEFPAVSESLCVNNLFQSNMVIQRDKPVRVWGWASPGEKVTVSSAGRQNLQWLIRGDLEGNFGRHGGQF